MLISEVLANSQILLKFTKIFCGFLNPLKHTFTGTWVSHDNPMSGTYVDLTQNAKDSADFFHFQKFVFTSEKNFSCYHSVDDMLPFGPGKYTVINSWVDRKGNTYCKAKCQILSGSRLHAFWKLNVSNTVLEQNFYYGGDEKYPTKIIKHDDIEDDYSSTTGIPVL